MSNERQISEILLDDLRSRVQRASTSEAQGLELRKFLEAVHKAMASLLRFDSERVHIDQWVVRMKEFAKQESIEFKRHVDTYTALSEVYRQGNMPAHENEEAALVSREECLINFRSIEKRLPILVADMRALNFDLEAQILRDRETFTNHHRAQTLFDAITDAVGQDSSRLESEVWPKVEQVLRSTNEPILIGLRKNPKLDKRVHRAMVVHLAPMASGNDDCPLLVLARHLASTLDLAKWLLDDARHQAILRATEKSAPLFRVVIDTDVLTEGGAIRRAVVFDENLNPWDVPAEYPLQASSAPALFLQIKKVFERFADHSRATTGGTPRPRDFVLQIAVPRESAMQDWEGLKPPGPQSSLIDEFLAVTVDPLDDYDSRVDMRESLAPDTLALIWQGTPQEVVMEYRDHVVLLVGPTLWCTEIDGLPPILWMMSQRAGALLLPEIDAGDALERLELGDMSSMNVTWMELVGRAAQLKRDLGRTMQHAYRILLTDARYHSMDAYSL